jgi:hypothetical protein
MASPDVQRGSRGSGARGEIVFVSGPKPSHDATPSGALAPTRAEETAMLHEEIGRLPDWYRTAVVLCDLEGLTHEEAARRLGCPTGTVGVRLMRARERLRARLIRRGMTPAPLAPLPLVRSAEPLTTSLVLETGRAASSFAFSNAAIYRAVPSHASAIAATTAHRGRASLHLRKSAQRFFPIAQWYQTVKRQGDAANLKVAAFVKAQKLTKAILDVQFADRAGNATHQWAAYIGPKEDGAAPFTHDWKEYAGVVAIPAGTAQLTVAAQIYGPGDVWFDDVVAEYTDAKPTDPLSSTTPAASSKMERSVAASSGWSGTPGSA